MSDQKPDAAEPKVLYGSFHDLGECVNFILDASGHIPDAALPEAWELLTPEAREALHHVLWIARGGCDQGDCLEELDKHVATLGLGGIK